MQGEESWERITLSPVNYFSFAFDCHHRSQSEKNWTKDKYLVPVPSELCNEVPFAKVYASWDQEGLYFTAKVNAPARETFLPDPVKGDSLELFIDTRNLKSAGFNHKFCHHFCFLPIPCDGVNASEITHFRTEDTHELCSPEDLKNIVRLNKKNYDMEIHIPGECLYGYDSEQIEEIGFNYRVNRFDGTPQHLFTLSSEFSIGQLPTLWGNMRLVQ